jgi:hypothetical protein
MFQHYWSNSQQLAVTSVLLEYVGVSCTVGCYFSTAGTCRCQLYCWLLLQYCWNMSVAVVLLAVTSVLLEHVGVSCTVGCYFSTVGTCRCQLYCWLLLQYCWNMSVSVVLLVGSNSTEVTANSTTDTDMFQQYWSNSQQYNWHRHVPTVLK